jgi:hypothetical protein
VLVCRHIHRGRDVALLHLGRFVAQDLAGPREHPRPVEPEPLAVGVVPELLLAVAGDGALAKDLDDLPVGRGRAAVVLDAHDAVIQEQDGCLEGIGGAVDR